MKAPLSHRGKIPFYCHKTDLDYQRDSYERYDSMVLRQAALHLADECWGGYPMQAVLDFAAPHYPKNPQHIVEIGSGVGRWVATVAQDYPQAICWGIDYSYQMLRQAHKFWVEGQAITLNLANRGLLAHLELKGKQLDNIHWGLAKASQLPFVEESQDLVLSSFLLDRLQDPAEGLLEMSRVLQPNGTLILITPLNFDQASNWQQYYPASKIQDFLQQIGMEVVEWQEDILIQEPLDGHGNGITWKCLGLVGLKRS